MKPSIVEFVTAKRMLALRISPAQETLLRWIYGLPLVNDEQREISRHCLQREGEPPEGGFPDVTVLAGARSGKGSRIGAPIVCYEACFGGHEKHLGKGERATIPLVAQDQRATAIDFELVKAYFQTPLLAKMVEDVLATTIKLKNHVTIACFPCTLRSLRGWSIPVAVLDEVAFFRLEGQADSDAEIQASVRRGGVAFPDTRLVKISTPYLKSGVLYDDFKSSFGKDDPDRLVWRAPSKLMNPSLGGARLERERRLDPSRFAREFEAEFAEDVDSFLPTAWIEGAVVTGRHQLPPVEDRTYYAAIDVAGAGTSKRADAFTLSIVHAEGQGASRKVVQDLLKGWRGSRTHVMDLESIVAEIAEILKPYGLRRVGGDAYGGGWCSQAFPRHGLEYVVSSLDKSQAYLACEPLFAEGRIELLDHEVLIRELKNLEKRPKPGGKITVDHPKGSFHDDHANSLCLAAAHVARQRASIMPDLGLAYQSGQTFDAKEDAADYEPGTAVPDPGGVLSAYQRRSKQRWPDGW